MPTSETPPYTSHTIIPVAGTKFHVEWSEVIESTEDYRVLRIRVGAAHVDIHVRRVDELEYAKTLESACNALMFELFPPDQFGDQ